MSCYRAAVQGWGLIYAALGFPAHLMGSGEFLNQRASPIAGLNEQYPPCRELTPRSVGF